MSDSRMVDFEAEIPGFGKPVIFKTKRVPGFSDLDPYGHLNSEVYFKYYIDHRFEGMRTFLNLKMDEMVQWPITIPVVEMKINYYRSVLADQEVDIESAVTRMRPSTCEVNLRMMRKGELMSKATMILASVDKKTGQACQWPEGTLHRFFQGH